MSAEIITILSCANSYALWYTELLSGEASLGVGALAVAILMRWTVGRWEKAKRTWWQNWTRVCQGLDRDLKVRFLS